VTTTYSLIQANQWWSLKIPSFGYLQQINGSYKKFSISSLGSAGPNVSVLAPPLKPILMRGIYKRNKQQIVVSGSIHNRVCLHDQYTTDILGVTTLYCRGIACVLVDLDTARKIAVYCDATRYVRTVQSNELIGVGRHIARMPIFVLSMLAHCWERVAGLIVFPTFWSSAFKLSDPVLS
jgi:hypothetical protein